MLHALALYLLQAMMVMEPIANHHYYEPASVTEARYTALAYNIAAAVEDPDEEPVFSETEYGIDARWMTGLLLVSIWHMESHGIAGVMLCQRGGDGAMSWGSFQTQIRKGVTCGSYLGAAHVALKVARESFALSGKTDPLQGLRAYAAGSKWRSNEAGELSRKRVGDALEYARVHPFMTDWPL